MNLVLMTLLDYINDPHISVVDRCIGEYIVKNINQVSLYSINQLAKSASVSISQVSRFIKHIGFQSFSDFKELLNVHGHSQRHSLLQRDNQMEVSTYQKYVQEEIQYFFEHFSFDMLDEFIYDLLSFSKIGMFGILNSENMVKNLHYDLAMKGIMTYSFSHFIDQLSFIENADDQTLIVIYSISGEYVTDNCYSRYYQTLTALKKSRAKIYVVTNNKKLSHFSYLDRIIHIPIKNQLYHYSLQCFNDVVLLELQKHRLP